MSILTTSYLRRRGMIVSFPRKRESISFSVLQEVNWGYAYVTGR